MKILLDTHILVWWYLNNSKLPDRYCQILDEVEVNNEQVYVSDISIWEIAKLVELNRLKLSTGIDTWLSDIMQNPSIEMIRISPAISVESTRLGDSFHKDPADQIIVATARVHNLHLMTVDKRVVSSRSVLVV